MTIARRQVVGLGALGIGAFALDGCGSLLPLGQSAAAHPEDVDRILRELDHVIADLGTLEADPTRFGIKGHGVDVETGRAMCMRLLKMLCFLGTYRDIPESMWTEPRIAERLAKTLPQIHAVIVASRNQLANLDEAEGARIDKRLQDDAGITTRILERIDEYAKQVHVPLEQRTYLRTATMQLAGRFRYEGTKDVTAKLAQKFARTSAQRLAALGMQLDQDAQTGGDQKPEEPAPMRAQFHTQASAAQARSAACSIDSKVIVDGTERQVVLDWDEARCLASTTTRLKDDQPPIHATVHMEPGAGGTSLVTVTLFPPAGVNANEALTASVTSIAEYLQKMLATNQPCVTSADCGPLRCIAERCRDPYAKAPSVSPPVQSRFGERGESCRTKADCESALDCSHGVCSAEALTSSARLINTTRDVAKWGAYLSIPPICAIGALVLLSCLFMVIVAGCMYAGGD